MLAFPSQIAKFCTGTGWMEGSGGCDDSDRMLSSVQDNGLISVLLKMDGMTLFCGQKIITFVFQIFQ